MPPLDENKTDFKTVWQCDVCKIKSFPTIEEATAHEAQCEGAPAATAAPPIPQAADDEQQPTTMAAADTKQQSFVFFKCHNCKILFRTKPAAAEHEKSCREPEWENCSKCKVMRFRTAAELEVHEGKCEGQMKRYNLNDLPIAKEEKKEPETIDLLSSSDDEDGQDQQEEVGNGGEKKVDGDVKKEEAGNEPSSGTNSEVKSGEVQSNDITGGEPNSGQGEKPTENQEEENGKEGDEDGSGSDEGTNQDGGDNSGYTTVWKCDFCKTAQFETFEEAEAHEKTCKDRPGEDNATVTNLPSTPPPKSIGPNSKRVTLLSPLINPSSPEAAKLSSHFSIILQSLDLLYHPYSAFISFQCHYCSSKLPATGISWNLTKLVEVLPNMTKNHLLGNGLDDDTKGCAAAPNHVVEKLMSVDNVESSRIRTFETFIQSYLAENKVEGKKSDRKFVYVPALSSTGKVSPSALKKRQAPEKDVDQSPVKKQRDTAFPVSLKVKIGNLGSTIQTDDEGKAFYLSPSGPLDGVPLVSSFTSQQSKSLPVQLQCLLQQVEFFNLSSLKLPPSEKIHSPQSVGIRCQNCVSNPNGCGYIKLSSVKELSSDLLTMSSDHILYCTYTESSVKTKLRGITGQDSHTLTNYCQLITKLYGLENSYVDGGVVVWGECPSIPSGYVGSPTNINIDFALLDSATDCVGKLPIS